MRIILIIALLAGVGAVGLGVLSTKPMFESAQEKVTKSQDDLELVRSQLADWKIKSKEADDALVAAKSESSRVEILLRNQNQDLAFARSQQSSLERELEDLAEKKRIADESLAQLEQIFEEAGITVQGGINADEIGLSIAELEDQLSSMVDELEGLQVKLARTEQTASGLEDRVNALQDNQEERRKQLSLNSWSGMITSVDSDWGIVVFRGGSAQGLTPQNRCIVIRNGQRIAELQIISIEEQKTMANLVTSDFANELKIQVGDQVILAESN